MEKRSRGGGEVGRRRRREDVRWKRGEGERNGGEKEWWRGLKERRG